MDGDNVLLAEDMTTGPYWPVTVTAVAGRTDAVDVTWEAVEGAFYYFISVDGGSRVEVNSPRPSRRFTGLKPDAEYTFTLEAVSAMRDGFETLAEREMTGRPNAALPAEQPAKDPPAKDPPADDPADEAAVFVIYHDPNAGAAAVGRYDQAIALLKEAGISCREVEGDVRDDAARLAGVTNSIMPRFFVGDPTASGWVSETKVNNGGLRWLKLKLAELSGD